MKWEARQDNDYDNDDDDNDDDFLIYFRVIQRHLENTKESILVSLLQKEKKPKVSLIR